MKKQLLAVSTFVLSFALCFGLNSHVKAEESAKFQKNIAAQEQFLANLTKKTEQAQPACTCWCQSKPFQIARTLMVWGGRIGCGLSVLGGIIAYLDIRYRVLQAKQIVRMNPEDYATEVFKDVSHENIVEVLQNLPYKFAEELLEMEDEDIRIKLAENNIALEDNIIRNASGGKALARSLVTASIFYLFAKMLAHHQCPLAAADVSLDDFDNLDE